MLAVDDILDDAHWVNVQDPIKQMFLSITKALRVQASSLRELDRKCSDFVSKDFVRHQVHTVEESVCSKQDATQIIYQLQQKVDQKEYIALQTRHEQVVQNADQMQSAIREQALEIQGLQAHIGSLEKEIEVLKHPSYDQIFAYIDRQVQNLTQDTERKLAVKAEKREMETVIPQRLEDLYRNLNAKYQDIKVEVAKTATKEELMAIAQAKADRSECRELAADLHEKVSRAESASLINTQTKPLFTALAALEKAHHASDQRILAQQHDVTERVQTLQRQFQDHVTTLHPPHTTTTEKWTPEKVTSIVQEYLRERKLEDLSRVHLDGMFANHTDYMLKQMGILGESIRLEIVSGNREEMNMLQQKYEASLNDTKTQTKEVTEKHQKTRQAVKELSANVTKALGKKVDVSDYQRLVKKLNEIEKWDDSSRIRARLTASTASSTEFSGRKHPTNVVSSNDPNETFDILIQSLKSSSSSTSSSSSSTGGDNKRHQQQQQHSNVTADIHRDHHGDWEEDGEERLVYKARLPRSAHKTAAVSSSSSFTRTKHLQRSSSLSPSKSAVWNRSTVSFGGGMTVDALQEEIDALQGQMQMMVKRLATLHTSQTGSSASSVGHQEVDRLDWRIALGDLSLQLRRDLSDKVSREEMLSLVKDETALLTQKIKPIEQVIHKEWNVLSTELPQEVSRVTQDLSVVKQRISAEITGARFLWTSGRFTGVAHLNGKAIGSHSPNWIPWERQVLNASPNCIIWRKDSPVITIKVPGLYLLTVSMFTTNTSLVHKIAVYLNDEPLFTLQNTSSSTVTFSTHTTPKNSLANAEATSTVQPVLTRYRHSLGEVSSLTLEEYVSLPPEARLTVCLLPERKDAFVDAVMSDEMAPQGFLALKKL